MSFAYPQLTERRDFLLWSVAIGGAALLGTPAHAADDDEFMALAIEESRRGVENAPDLFLPLRVTLATLTSLRTPAHRQRAHRCIFCRVNDVSLSGVES